MAELEISDRNVPGVETAHLRNEIARMTGRTSLLLPLLLLTAIQVQAGAETAAERGFRLLTEKPYLPPDFHQETFDQIWQSWPEPLRSRAASASIEERRRMAFERYGLTTRPGDDTGRPLQYVVSENGDWTMNCFACHGGSINGVASPGVPNANLELATLTDEIRSTKLRLGKPLTRMDVGSLFMPLGTSTGTTNAVMFGVALLSYREPDLTRSDRRLPPAMVHHDMDAPPWWHFHRKKHLYIDGFAPTGTRPLMQFMLVEENGPDKFKKWEADFEHVFAYLKSLRPPAFTGRVDEPLATKGEIAFRRVCSDCHGTYGPDGDYPERVIPLDEIGTDPVRLEALTPQHRSSYHKSWFGHFGEKSVDTDPEGYVAPPLDGIWASAPYFHNGSVPTLWHVLHPQQRPVVWRRSGRTLDFERMGLAVEEFRTIPDSVSTRIQRRRFFDTRLTGKSASGHDFVDRLSEEEKVAVLEYLKTL